MSSWAFLEGLDMRMCWTSCEGGRQLQAFIVNPSRLELASATQ